MLRTIPITLLCLSLAGCFGPLIEYHQFWNVTGELRDAQTDEPLVEANVLVTLLRGGEQIGEELTRTDQAGRFGVYSYQEHTAELVIFLIYIPPKPIGPPPDTILLRISTANGEITETIAVDQEMIERRMVDDDITISGIVSLPTVSAGQAP